MPNDGDVSSIDTSLDNVVVMRLKSNSLLLGWFINIELQIKRALKQLNQTDLSREEKRELEEKLKKLQTVCRERTGACKHNLVLSYLLQCQQKTVVFGWHRDIIDDLASKLRQQERGRDDIHWRHQGAR
jgi:hypothetical protein